MVEMPGCFGGIACGHGACMGAGLESAPEEAPICDVCHQKGSAEVLLSVEWICYG